MEKIRDYILTIENAMPYNQLDVLKKVCESNHLGNEPGVVGLNRTYDPNIRKTRVRYLFNAGEDCKSMTMAYWTNYLIKLFTHYKRQYCNAYKINYSDMNVAEMQLLTYSKGNFYKTHVDHFRNSPRILSFVFLINDNYEGGELYFELVNEIIKIPAKQGSLIIWPSGFQYPHGVLPVTKGERYSVVSWAL
jgi:hypothetical protein